MARQCVKLRRTNPAHALEGNLFHSEPELGVLSCSPAHMEGVLGNLGQDTATQHMPAHPPLLRKQFFVCTRRLEDRATSGRVRRYAGSGTYFFVDGGFNGNVIVQSAN